MTDSDRPDVAQVLMLDSLREQFTVWLNSRGWECIRAPWLDDEDGEGLPTYLTAPSQETWNRHKQAGVT